jgi:L-methionine (R)-S-oxide reductase
MNRVQKEALYKELLPSIEAMIEGEEDLITILSSITCELYHAFDHWNWVGFYRRVDERTLKVGPYQGTHGCLTIDVGQGVCGACVRENSTQLIKDVSKVDDHIACSSDTKSEIVLPIMGESGTVLAVLDLDSTALGAFDEMDKEYLSKVVDWIRPLYDRYSSRYIEENQSGTGVNLPT